MKRILTALMLFTSIYVYAQSDVPVFLQKNWYAKIIANVFSLIEEGKLVKAEKEWEEIKKKFEKDKEIDRGIYSSAQVYLYPIWDISKCVLMNTKAGRENQKEPIGTAFDPWMAYKNFKSATSDFSTRKNIDIFFLERKLKYTTSSIKDNIESNLIEATAKIGTEQAYDKLISTLYDYKDIGTLEKKREQIAYDVMMNTREIAKLQHYLDKYKLFNISHHDKIEHRRDSIAFEELGKNATACKQYLNNYPRSKYNAQVTKLLHKYEFEELPHTVIACQNYLSSYPKSEYVDQVKKLMADYAYNDIKKEGTIDAYSDYLRSFGQSEKTELAKQELSRMICGKFFNANMKLNELKDFVNNRELSSWIDYKPYDALYANLRHLPTSSAMLECKDLTGEVNTHVSVGGNEYDETYFFDESGLLSQHRHSRNGQNETWDYYYGENGEVRTVSKTDNRGKETSYKTTFNEANLISEISGSDGSSISYTYNYDNSLKTVSYSKGGKKYQIDTFENDRIVKSDRSGITLVYEYNSQGDVMSMTKKRGSIAMEQTTYDYEYDSTGNYWRSMDQYNNGSFFLVKKRSFTIPDPYRTTERRNRWGNQSASYSNNTNINRDVSYTEGTQKTYVKSSNDKVYDVVEQMPSFPGGMPALMSWLNQNIKYPEIAAKNGVQGRVLVQFVVEEDGSLTGEQVAWSVDPSLDKEAVRVVKTMPKWNPGKQNGSAVRVKYTVPVTFKLQ